MDPQTANLLTKIAFALMFGVICLPAPLFRIVVGVACVIGFAVCLPSLRNAP